MKKWQFLVIALSSLVLSAGFSASAALGENRISSQVPESSMLIDDFSNPGRMSALGTFWRGFTDQVMGGVSTASSKIETIDGRPALRLSGDVSLKNNGGFIQVALPLTGSGAPLDVSAYRGIRLSVRGNGETYHLHLRTTTTTLPWQYYHAAFPAGSQWATVELFFDGFEPAAMKTKLDPSRLTRLAVVASKKEFRADIAVSKIEFFK
jgi:hypothetical protein